MISPPRELAPFAITSSALPPWAPTPGTRKKLSGHQVLISFREEDLVAPTTNIMFSGVETLKKYRLDVPQVTELAWELKKAGVPLKDGILSIEELMDQLVPLFGEKAAGK